MATAVKTPAVPKERKAIDSAAKNKGSDEDKNYGSGRNTVTVVAPYDEDEDRRHVAAEEAALAEQEDADAPEGLDEDNDDQQSRR